MEQFDTLYRNIFSCISLWQITISPSFSKYKIHQHKTLLYLISSNTLDQLLLPCSNIITQTEIIHHGINIPLQSKLFAMILYHWFYLINILKYNKIYAPPPFPYLPDLFSHYNLICFILSSKLYMLQSIQLLFIIYSWWSQIIYYKISLIWS